MTTTIHRHRHLTPAMRDALRRARSEPLRRVHRPGPGRAPWPHHPSTLAALVRNGFVVRGEHHSRRGNRTETWTITDAGREALDPPPDPPKPDRPTLLVQRPGRSPNYRTLPSGRLQAVGQGLPPAHHDERDASGDYTSSSFRAMRHEPESIDEQTLLDFADDARRRFVLRRARVRSEAAAERFERAARRAREQGIDVAEQTRAVERMAASLERRAEGAA